MPTGDFAYRPLRPGLDLYVHTSPRFKTVSLQAALLWELGRDATHLALLPMVLRRGTERHPTQQALVRFLEGLYGAGFDADVRKAGESHVLLARITTLSPAYADEGEALLDEATRFLADILSKPRLENGVFPDDIVAREKENLFWTIQGLVNNRDSYAVERLVRTMCAGERFATYEYGDIADLKGVDGPGLADFWRKVTRTAPIALFAVGDVDPDRLAAVMAQQFSWDRDDIREVPPTTFRPAPVEPRRFEEAMMVSQERLLQGYRLTPPENGDDLAARLFFSGILGGFSFSKLFRNAREKQGLAYDVGCFLERHKGLLIVYGGVKPGNSSRLTEEIRRALDSLRRGEITRLEMDNARQRLMTEIHSVLDGPATILGTGLDGLLSGRIRSSAEYEAEVMSVTREDVARAARSATLDTTFVLAPSS